MKLSLLLVAAAVPLGAQQAPTVRLIAAPDAASKQILSAAAAVRQLPSGRVIVNDVVKRQLVMFDQSLANPTVIVDSTSGGASSYGPSAGAIIGYFGDSTLFIDPRDLTMFVLDPTGNIARVAAVPRSQDAGALGSNLNGTPAFDSKGRLVYRGTTSFRFGGAPSKTGPTIPDVPDSAAIVRVDLVTRKLDTAAFYKISKQKITLTQTDKGPSILQEINPMQVVDDWAVLADGSIAIVRGRDYHVDVLTADGAIASAAKMPFDWQRLGDEDKVAIIDSVKTAMEKSRAASLASMAAGGGGRGAPGIPVGGEQRIVMAMGAVGDGGKGFSASSALPPLNFVSPSELPDYRPAFTAASAKADLDGNLWLRTSAIRQGGVAGVIYDVINGKGELVDRIQIPAGRTIVGFGKGGVVYMMALDDKGAWIERTHR